MLIPLKQFICDTCGEIIEKPEDGYIEWRQFRNKETNMYEVKNFHIVHHISALPNKNLSMGCQHLDFDNLHDMPLNSFIDENYKMANLLRFIDMGDIIIPDYKQTHVLDVRNFVETFRRLTIPYYEEARLYWNEAKDDGCFDGASEVVIYSVNLLKGIVDKYSR